MDRDRHTATQDVPLLSLCNCLPNAHVSMKKELKREMQTLLHFHKQHVFTQWWCSMIHLGCAPAAAVSQPTTQLLNRAPRKRPVSSQVEHFIWNFIFCSLSYSLSHIQWKSCHFLAAGGINSHCCIYKPAFLLFHFLVFLKTDSVKELFIFAKTKLNNYIWDDSEIRCLECRKCISTWSSTFRVRDKHTCLECNHQVTLHHIKPAL